MKSPLGQDAPSRPPAPPTDRPLRVGLNLIFLEPRAGGTGRYAMELPGALLAAEPDTEVHVFVSRDAPAQLRSEPWASRVRWITVPVRISGPPIHALAQFAALPALARARGLDVLHSPGNWGPVLTPGLASVVSLLDLIWLHRPAEWSPSSLIPHKVRLLVRHSVRHADRLVAISHAAADDLVNTLGVARDRVEVTPLGVRVPTSAPAVGEAELRARLRLGAERVVLCVAQKRPYKNLHSLVRALAQLEQDVCLVLPGAPTAYEAELRALAAELGVASRVRFPDWLEEDELDRLYRLSSAFVLPSLIEGFGLPVLEAMARGVPVACANVAALPEVAGDAALLFDPTRQEEVTGALRRLLEDRALAQRLAGSGRERVKSFPWQRTGAATLAGYRRAVATRSNGAPSR
jgi:glycosyltransferase involved in cell wall biosynthesis